MKEECLCLTYRYRLRDKHAAMLNRQARAVNVVFNYCNEMQRKAVQSGRQWLNDVDLQRLTAGSGSMLGLRAQTVSRICRQYHRARRQHKKAWLRFRNRRSLGWIPIHPETFAICDGGFRYMGVNLRPMHWRNIPAGADFKDSSFCRDADGHWYLNLCFSASSTTVRAGTSTVGVDLGLKSIATLSDGSQVANPRHLARLAERHGKAQRAGKKRLARCYAAKVANARKDHLHKASARIALTHDLIFVGDISSSKLSQTRFAKSVYDASWAAFRDMLRYKAMRHGGCMIEVNETLTSQTCSSCGDLPPRRPRGIAGLGIREFSCACGVVIDRDVNAARNILARGLASLAEGTARRAEQPSRAAKASLTPSEGSPK